MPEEELDEGKLNIFTKVKLDDQVKAIVGSTGIARFSEPLISKTISKDKIELLERLMGRAASQANPMTNEILKDMAIATEYPPAVEGVLMASEEVVAIANELCDYVTSLKTKSQEEDV
jgi:intracellular multiplication protein IcmO